MSADITIRRARPGDETALALVGQATFLETFSGVIDGAAIIAHCARAHSVAQYAQWLEDSDTAIWLVEVAPGNAPVGFMVVTGPDLPMADPSSDLEIKRIYLLSRFQGGGIGKRLLGHATAQAKSVGAARLLLGVYSGNAPALGFYRQQGFTNLTTRQFTVGGQIYDDYVLSLAVAD